MLAKTPNIDKHFYSTTIIERKGMKSDAELKNIQETGLLVTQFFHYNYEH